LLHEYYDKSDYEYRKQKCSSECYMNAVTKVIMNIENERCSSECYMKAVTK
jgi:hypothetical protein